MNRVQKIIGTAAIAALCGLSPLAASAASVNANASSGVFISPSGIVRVIGADVTSVGSGVIDAVAHFGNVVLNFVVNTSAATKFGGATNASTTPIAVGDQVAFAGSLSASSGTSLTVSASKVRDLTAFPPHHVASTTKESSKDNDNDSDTGGRSLHAGLGILGGLHLGKDK